MAGTESRKRNRASEEVEEEVGDFNSCMTNIRTQAEELINNIANPSIKINKTNQKEMRRVLMGIVEQTTIQSNAINYLIGRLTEQREITNMLVEKRDSVFTCADTAKKQERKRSISRKRGDTVVALIYPNVETESEITKDEVKNINPINLGLGIKRVKKSRKGGVLMEVTSQADFDKLQLEVNSNENLRENYTISKGTKLKPKIIIYDVN